MEYPIFDTELTLLYKTAYESGLPIELFILRPRTVEDDDISGTGYTVIESIYDFINRKLDQNSDITLEELYQEFEGLKMSNQFPYYLAWVYLQLKAPQIIDYAEMVDRRRNYKGYMNDQEFLDAVLEVIKLYVSVSDRGNIPGVDGGDLYDVEDGVKFFKSPSPRAVKSVFSQFKELRELRETSSTEMKTMKEIAENINDIQGQILALVDKPYSRSPIYKKSEHIIYKAYLSETVEEEGLITYVRPISREDGFSFFNNSRLSEDVPFIQYNTLEKGAEKSYYKIFRGETVDREPNYKNIMIPPEETTEVNTINMKVWFHHPNETRIIPMHMAPASAFITVVLSLSHKEGVEPNLSFDVPHVKDLEDSMVRYLESLGEAGEDIDTYGATTVSEWVILKAVYNALSPNDVEGPSLLFDDRVEESVKAEIFIYGPDIDNTTFTYDIAFNNLLRWYLYIEEFTHPQALQNQLRVRYAPYPIDDPNVPDIVKQSPYVTRRGLSAAITQEYSGLGEVYDVYDYIENVTKRQPMPAETPYIVLNISRTADTKAIEEFLNTFTHLLPIYMNNKPEIIEYYSQYMTVKEQRILFPQPPTLDEPEEREMLIDLNKILPELTKYGFKRGVQRTSQPKAILKKDIDEWVRQTFINRSLTYHKEVLPFPKPEPTAYGTVVLVAFHNDQVMYLVQRPSGILEWKLLEEIEGKVNDPEAWVACPLDKSPFIGLKDNPNETRDQYPYVPKCFDTLKTSQAISGKVTRYQKYYLGFKEERTRQKVENILVTNKILKPGHKGQLDEKGEINAILNQYPSKISKSVFLRYGVPISPNSLLHSVLLALGDPEYYKKVGTEQKEAYVRRVRKYIATKIYPGLLKQELYDRTLSEIWAMLCDVTSFLDPSVFYRALEVVFNINIYVYGYTTGKDGKKAKQGKMVLPRHKIFHTQPYRDRPTILILKNSGSETDVLEYPQSELIIEDIKGAKPVMVFKEEMGRINYDVLQQTARIFTWKITKANTLEVHQNTYLKATQKYSEPDYSALIDHQGRYQILDDYGKLRGLVFSSVDGQGVTMLFDPSQPVNLPLTTKERLASCDDPTQFYEDDVEVFPRCKPETATRIFGKPVSMTKNPDGYLTGLWFGTGTKVYIPTDLTQDKRLLALPVGDGNPFETTEDESVFRLDKMKKDLNYIQQIFWWLYIVYRSEREKLEFLWDLYIEFKETAEIEDTLINFLQRRVNFDVEPHRSLIEKMVEEDAEPSSTFINFIETYVDYDNDYEGDSAFYYNLNGINRTFPDEKEVVTVEEGIKDLEEQEQYYLEDLEEDNLPGGTLFRDGHILFYNRTYVDELTGKRTAGFGEKMVEWLQRKVKLLYGLEDVQPNLLRRPKTIENYYTSSKDFVPQDFVSVFIGRSEVKKWLDSITTSAQMHKIHREITPALSLSTEPFIFQDIVDKKIYYIQNVIGGSKERALNVGRMWQTEKRNSGWRTPPTEANYPHIIYGNLITGLIIMEDNRTVVQNRDIPIISGSFRRKEPSTYLRILQYNTRGTPRYAAMLELL